MISTLSAAALPTPLRGIVPPMISPLTAAGTLDPAALERLVEHLLAGGVHGLFLLGTTGEGTSLPRIIGIKDTSGDPEYLPALQRLITRSDFCFLIGNELRLSEMVLAGGHGSICGGANFEPATFVALYDAAARRDMPAIATLRER